MFAFSPFPDFDDAPDDTSSWVRLLLTGDPESTTPTSTVISAYAVACAHELLLRYPTCLEGAPGALTGDDLTAYTEALGALIAAKIVLAPGGQTFVRYVTSLKQGTTTQGFGPTPLTAMAASKTLHTASNTALARIACIRTAQAARNAGSLFGVAGRRRAQAAACGTSVSYCPQCGCVLSYCCCSVGWG